MLKKLINIFVVDDGEGGPKKETTAPQNKADSNTPAGAKPGVPPLKSGTRSGKANQKFMEVLLNAMDKKNLEGFDYLEFKQSLRALEKMPMDEKTRFQSAFAAAQTMGATPDKLVKAADHYIRVLTEEEAKFEQALGNQRNKKIGNKEQQIKQLDLLMKEKSEKIRQLTQEIDQHKKLKDKLATEISSAAQKVETTKTDFLTTYHALVGQIQSDIEKIKTYLK